MTPTEIMLQFTAITFPFFVAIPTFIAYFPQWPTRKIFSLILILYFVPFFDLWASVILSCQTLLSKFSPDECLIPLLALPASALLLSIGMWVLSWFLSERALESIFKEP